MPNCHEFGQTWSCCLDAERPRPCTPIKASTKAASGEFSTIATIAITLTLLRLHDAILAALLRPSTCFHLQKASLLLLPRAKNPWPANPDWHNPKLPAAIASTLSLTPLLQILSNLQRLSDLLCAKCLSLRVSSTYLFWLFAPLRCKMRSELGTYTLSTVLTFQEQSIPSEPAFLLPCVWSRFSASVPRSLSKLCKYSNATLRFYSMID